MRLRNKVVIVTGGSSGIGLEIVRTLGRDHAKLVLAAREQERLERACMLTEAETLAVPTDVTKEADCQNLVEATLERWGTIDVLVNNAGFAPPAKLLETTEEIWDVTVNSCLKSVYLMTRAVVPTMIENGGGAIVNISSVAGKYGYSMRTAYCAAKWGVHGFTEALRAELEDRNISAHLICPGAVATPWWDAIDNPQPRSVLKRMIQSTEVAEAVRYVLTQSQRIQIDEIMIKTNGSPWTVG